MRSTLPDISAPGGSILFLSFLTALGLDSMLRALPVTLTLELALNNQEFFQKGDKI